jgi:2-phosphoglycerate kinase
MVILIAGASYVGKTLMAQKLLEKYKIPYLSIDHIKMGLYRSGIDYGFTPESEDEIITGKIWPIIKGIIMTNIENSQNIIIEGCYFPYTINDFDKKYLSKIIFLYIIFSEKYIKENLLKNIYEKRNVVEKRGYESEKEYMEKLYLINKKNKDECIKNNIKYFEIDNDYDKEIKIAYKWIENEIKRNR